MRPCASTTTMPSGAAAIALRSSSSVSFRSGIDRSVVYLLCEVVRLAELTDQFELRLEPVGVFFLAGEDVVEQFPRAVIALADAQRDAAVEPVDGFLLDVECQRELLGHGLADAHSAEALKVRVPVEIEDAL